MTYAQALAIAAAAMVFAEPHLPQHAYRRVEAALSRIESHAIQRWRRLDTGAASLPDRRCINRAKLYL